jgi:alginate O-acetyltransferase complex protein AlgI
MSYTIDVYRGQVPATRNLIDFACCITAFPHLVAGPIIRYRDLATQAVGRTISRESFVYGIERFAAGLGKKVLIANTLAVAADQVFALPARELTCGLAWLGAAAYTLQIYFDFSGYSDMAVGLGRMLGFEFIENFNYPYAARSIQDFWRRWHISLSTWLRDYVYIPLGGSRASAARTYGNLVIVFFLCGLWHGARWSFVLWGLYHGLLLVLERAGILKFPARGPAILGRAYTILAVMLGWILFRTESVHQTSVFLRAMAGFARGSGTIHNVAVYATIDVWIAGLIGVLLATPLLPACLRRLRDKAVFERGFLDALSAATQSLVRTAWVLGILAVCSVFLAAGTHNPFIYFRF